MKLYLVIEEEEWFVENYEFQINAGIEGPRSGNGRRKGMNQNRLHDIGHEILQETFLLIRNVCSHPREDFYSMKYVRDIVDAIHNIPHSI